MIPIAVHAKALQLLALGGDPSLGIGAALGTELLGRNLVLVPLLLAVFLLDLPLDRQAVAIPAGHIGRVHAQQALGADDHVLEDVIERMADVDVAIGIGRAIVEDELLAASAGIAQGSIEIHLLPARKDARLLLGKASLHGEIGLRQEDGVTVIAWFGHSLRALAGEAG